jgi:two-component system sensor histidine kinase ResE
MFRSIFWRLVASQVVVALFAVAAAGVLSYRLFRNHYMAAEEEELIRIGRELGDLAAPVLTDSQRRGQVATIARTAGVAVDGRVCIFGATAQDLLAASGDERTDQIGDAPAVYSRFAGHVRVERTSAKCEPRQNLTVMVPVNSAQGPVGSVIVRAPVAGTEAILGQVRHLSLLTALGAGAAAFLLSMVVSRTIASPLRRISRASASIGDGQFATRVDPVPAGEVGELAATVNHMAERLQGLFEELSEEKANLEGVLGGMAEGVIAIDREGRVTFANRPAHHLLAATADKWSGESLDDLLPDQTWVTDAMTAAREGGEPSPACTAEGESGGIRCKINALSGPAGGALVLLEDATKEHRLEQMRRAFVANASHQLRTPLTGMRGYVEALADGTAATEEARHRCIVAALEQVSRMQALIEKLMDLSRFDAGVVELEFEQVDIHDLLEGAATSFRPRLKETGVELELGSDADLPPVTVDGARIVDAVGNLIDNAIRVTPAGGTVAVSAERKGDAVRIAVRDQGPGIDEADADAIWERFFSRTSTGQKSGGMGLGLAIVKEIVSAHGGEVFARKRPEGGSVFGFELPIGGGSGDSAPQC